MVKRPVLAVLLLPLLGSGAFAEPAAPDWIWAAGQDRGAGGEWSLVRRFEAPAGAKGAVLRATADFAGLRVLLNGREAIALEPYDPPGQAEVSRLLREGSNTLELRALSVAGPSAAGVSLEVDNGKGGRVEVRTGADWPGAVSLGPVEPVRWGLNRLPEVSPFAEYNQWKEALEQPDTASLSPLPPGFVVEKIRDAAEGEDSWVSLVFDPKGRILLGKEQRGLLRLTLSDHGGEVVLSETVEDSLQECRGLAWIGDTLYAHANRGKTLYALRGRAGDDRFDPPVAVQATEGGPGHGRNALVHGPDGLLHAIVGDDILVPGGAPRRARPERDAPKELGHWLRIGLPATPGGPVVWEAMNRGLRNPYGIDFNAHGEPFTYDADNEGDVGLPFYRASRVNHLVSGANYGWHQDRGNTRSLPVYAPDGVPTTFDVGRGSPTGVRFGGASRFPAPWRDALFALDWAYGRILAVHLAPHGAGYQATGEVFLEGRPLNVTDLAFDGEGAMWFSTGGRKTKSALYRIRHLGEASSAGESAEASTSPGGQPAARESFSGERRELRRRLERFHGRADPAALDEVWLHLGDPDPWLRNAARVALEWQPVASWRARALASGPDLAGLTALLALARAGTDDDRAAAARAASRFSPADLPRRVEALSLLRLLELADPPEDSAVRAAVLAQLDGLGPRAEPEVRRELARALVRLDAPDGVAYAMERLASSESQSDRLHYLEALSEAKAGWDAGRRKVFFEALAHARRFSYGDRFMAAFFQTLGENALSRLEDEAERERYAALLADEGKDGEEEAPRPPRSFVRHWTSDDLASPPEGVGKPDPARGRELYSAVLCARCHVCGTTGRPVGPDLTTVASRFSRRDLLEAILEPSAVVAEVHRNLVVAKNDGSTVMGRLVQNDFRESKLILATNPFVPSELVAIPKAEIRSWEESPVSPMPPALLDTLDAGEIEDLLAFLLSGGAGT